MRHLKIHIPTYEIGWKDILKNISFTLNESDRISIVGPNWAGKSTLMKIITWEIQEFDGNIDNIGSLRLGYLSQINYDNPKTTVYEELKDAFREVLRMEKKLKELEQQMQNHDTWIEIMEEYSSLLENFANIWGYDYDKEIHNVANGMKILDLLERKISEISGWQRTKIALAKILLLSPDILFLDEPTNFIDLASTQWLENYLETKWKWGYVIISHDREFLDKTCNKTYELYPQRPLTIYHCNYSDYVEEREKRETTMLEDYQRQQDYLQEQQWLVNRFRAGSRAGWAKSREKMLDKMEKLEPPYIPKKPKFQFEYIDDSSEKIISLKEAFIGRENPLFFIHDVILHRWQRVWIVGENGVGKSTLLKTIIWQIPLLDGYMSTSKTLTLSYYSQLHEELDKNKTIKENFELHGFHYKDDYLTAILNHYLFWYDDIHKKVRDLSGGQITKLHFAILGQKESNLLILDEPTNHLDYDSREALEFALKKYQWTLLFISHDRYFINKLATHIWFISKWELSLSYGNYEDYEFKKSHNLNMDFQLFDEQAQLSLVLEEKLGSKEFKRVKDRFSRSKKRFR